MAHTCEQVGVFKTSAMEGGRQYEDFQCFLKKFMNSIDPDDQLPIRVPTYNITKDEFQPEVVNFARQYLQDK